MSKQPFYARRGFHVWGWRNRVFSYAICAIYASTLIDSNIKTSKQQAIEFSYLLVPRSGIRGVGIQEAADLIENLDSTPEQEYVKFWAHTSTDDKTPGPPVNYGNVFLYRESKKKIRPYIIEYDTRAGAERHFTLIGDFSWPGDVDRMAAGDFNMDGFTDVLFYKEGSGSGMMLTYDKDRKEFVLRNVGIRTDTSRS